MQGGYRQHCIPKQVRGALGLSSPTSPDTTPSRDTFQQVVQGLLQLKLWSSPMHGHALISLDSYSMYLTILMVENKFLLHSAYYLILFSTVSALHLPTWIPSLLKYIFQERERSQFIYYISSLKHYVVVCASVIIHHKIITARKKSSCFPGTWLPYLHSKEMCLLCELIEHTPAYWLLWEQRMNMNRIWENRRWIFQSWTNITFISSFSHWRIVRLPAS